MHSRLMGSSTMIGSRAAPSAQSVSPAIMMAKADAIGLARRRQASAVRPQDSTAATPIGYRPGNILKRHHVGSDHAWMPAVA